MDDLEFERLKASVADQLNPAQCLDLSELLRRLARARLGDVAIERRTQMILESRRCSYCGHTDVVKHGRDGNGRQRFRCRSGITEEGEIVGCGRTFNGLTNTVLARMRKPDRWMALAATMGAHKSISKVVASGVGVSRPTAWQWRHRLLAIQSIIEPGQIGGVVEADETLFRTSYKGSRGWKRGTPPENRPPRYQGGAALKPSLSGEQVPVVTAVDRSGGSVERVLPSRAGIAASLVEKIEQGSVVCSDGLGAYVDVAVQSGSEHRRINQPRKDWLAKAIGGKPSNAGRLGLGRVNAHHQRLKTFVNRQANGVSTRYLPAYLGWQRAIRRPGFSSENLLFDTLIHTYLPRPAVGDRSSG